MSKLIILDNGHGKETPGKRSPVWGDGKQLFEWEFNRAIVNGIIEKLKELGIPFYNLVPEDIDIPLGDRCRRANTLYKKDRNCVLISIHANAGGGTGWECWTSVGQTKSDEYATIMCEQFKKDFPDQRMRFASAAKFDKESNFYILKNTNCPAVLTENFFMDTEKDCRFIMSEEGREKIINAHVEAIKIISKM